MLITFTFVNMDTFFPFAYLFQIQIQFLHMDSEVLCIDELLFTIRLGES